MARRRMVALAISGAALALVAAGASLLVLDGSDPAPGSGVTQAECTDEVVVSNPVEQAGHDSNRVTHVAIDGDMTACAGQTMLVEVDLDGIGVAHGYAVYQVPPGTTAVDLVFDDQAGDFYDTQPTPAGGTLAPAGSRLDPPKATEFGLVTVTIARTWE